MGRTAVIGLGNPVLSDDGVGLAVARELRRTLGWRDDVDVRELHVGGMAVMEACVGYGRVFVVDAMNGGCNPGTVYRSTLEQLGEAGACACAHDTTLATAFALGRFLDLPLPRTVRLWGIEPADVTTCAETLTEDVANAVPVVVAEIVASLDADGGAS